MNKYISYNRALLKRNRNQKSLTKWWSSWWRAVTMVSLLYITLAAVLSALPFHQPLVEFFDNIKRKLTINQIIISGNIELSEADILRCADVDLSSTKGANIWKIDPWQIRNNAAKCKMVKSIEIDVPFNGNVVIKIEERVPKVIWLTDDKLHLLDKDGLVISDEVSSKQKEDMVVLVGLDAPQNFTEVFDSISTHQYIKKNLASMHFVSNRRWNLFMQNRQIIKLPEKNAENAVEFWLLLREKYDDIANSDTIDLRLFPEKIYCSGGDEYKNQIAIQDIIDMQERAHNGV